MPRKQPQPREPKDSFWGSIMAQRFTQGTWLENEALTYPSGGFHRRARTIVTPNKHNPIELPYGEARVVRCGIPDTYFSIPARLKYKGKTVKGFLSIRQYDDGDVLTFTPEGKE